MLGVYATAFDTVEAHATYRRLPAAAALEKWRATVGPDFRFSPKAHLGISHRRDLDGVDDRAAAFVAAVAPLGSALGPVLVSLPHQEPDLARLDALLGAFAAAGGPPLAFELGPRWATTEVLDRLDRSGATLVVSDTDERPAGSLPSVGPVAYLRLRRAEYSPADLDRWADRLTKAAGGGQDAYAYLKHDDAATGPALARDLALRLDDHRLETHRLDG
jgi:uncharacterized protein YecE (DUF72 family)